MPASRDNVRMFKARRERKNQVRPVMCAPEEKQHLTEPIDQPDEPGSDPEHRLRNAQHHTEGIHEMPTAPLFPRSALPQASGTPQARE